MVKIFQSVVNFGMVNSQRGELLQSAVNLSGAVSLTDVVNFTSMVNLTDKMNLYVVVNLSGMNKIETHQNAVIRNGAALLYCEFDSVV